MKKNNFFTFFVGLSFIFLSLSCIVFNANNNKYNIKDYGAKGDGVTLNTEAFKKTIEACSKSGGGIVLVPKGTFLTGTIFLKSNITLYLDKGATIKGTRDLNSYSSFNPSKDRAPRNYRWYRALILGDSVENVTITGKGVIDGDHVPDSQGEEKMRGPHTILFGDSKNISMSDITIKNAANYAFLGWRIEKASFKNLLFNAGWDGIHVRWGKDITINKCEFYTGDDCIAGGAWENMIISDNIINSSCNGIRLIMPASNLQIKNCKIFGPGKFEHRTYKEKMRRNTYSGIVLQPGSWGKAAGTMEKITVQYITIDNVENPLSLVLNEDNIGKEILIDHVKATNIKSSACSVESWKGSTFDDVTFRNIQFEYVGSDDPETAKRELTRPGVDPRPLPCWAWFAFNINKLTLENIDLTYKGNEIRPAFIFENVKQLNLKNIKYSEVKNVKSVILKNVGEINAENVIPGLDLHQDTSNN